MGPAVAEGVDAPPLLAIRQYTRSCRLIGEIGVVRVSGSPFPPSRPLGEGSRSWRGGGGGLRTLAQRRRGGEGRSRTLRLAGGGGGGQPRSGIVVDLELVERQATGIEQVEHRLLDVLGEVQKQRGV